MRIYLQDSTGAVSRPGSLDETKPADIGLSWVDIDDPGGYSSELKGADFQLELPRFDPGTDGANPRPQQRADDLLITWSFPAGFDEQTHVTMKRLTTIATIFMPLTFLVGLYGMNFKYVPELTWRFGYLFAWTTIVVIAGAMVVTAKRKGWF